MEFNLKQFVSSRICLSCDGCCRFSEENSIWSPALTDKDILELSKTQPSSVKENKFRLQSYKGVFICPNFESRKNNCKIYHARPFDCQLYPFLLAKKDGKIFLGFDLKCPFLKDKHNSPEFKEFISYLLSFFKQKDIKDMIKNNPQLIADYKTDVVFLEELDFL
ncbi:MAG: YkgJ family cysteine cluster protein [Candidatus Omnitrophica bacterium]|nr:YkgJ family cysteine cluster protein [Candidatus Omnitrophota bacterium]